LRSAFGKTTVSDVATFHHDAALLPDAARRATSTSRTRSIRATDEAALSISGGGCLRHVVTHQWKPSPPSTTICDRSASVATAASSSSGTASCSAFQPTARQNRAGVRCGR
jgi:hypothetical protein